MSTHLPTTQRHTVLRMVAMLHSLRRMATMVSILDPYMDALQHLLGQAEELLRYIAAENTEEKAHVSI